MRHNARFTTWFNKQMQKRGMKPYEFATKAGISGQTAYLYSYGQSHPTAKKAAAIGKRLRLSLAHRRVLVAMVTARPA